MPKQGISRRRVLGGAAALAAGTLSVAAEESKPPSEPFRYMLNTSTIRGQKLPLTEEIAIAAKAGYHAIEPWISELDQHVKNGGSLKDLGKRIKDVGLTVESAIGFSEWIVDDDARRKKGLEQARHDLDCVQQIGGKRLAAPPAGAKDRGDLNLLKAAERYRALADIGEKIGVVPMVEFWGPSKCLSRLGEALLVAAESGYPKACVLADVYHMYKGGSGFAGLNLVGPQTIPVIHVNDYPATPARQDHRCGPRLPWRRHRAVEGNVPRPVPCWFSRRPLRGVVQPHLLDAGCDDGGEDGSGEAATVVRAAFV